MQNEKDPSKSSLTVSVSNPSVKSQADLDLEALTAEMEADMKKKGNALVSDFAFDKIKQMPMIQNALHQAIAFAPMGVAKMREYFQNGKIQVMIYIDEATGALVFEKVHMDNIDLSYKKDTPSEDFFIITKEDQDNPKVFIDKMQQKIGFNLF